MVRRITRPIKRWFRHGKPHIGDRELAMNAWFQTAIGQHLVKQEGALIGQIMNSKMGHHVTQLDCGLHLPLFDNHRFGCGSLVSYQANRAPCPSLCARPEQLPFDEASIDMALLHHTLDFCHNPYQVLRETARVVNDGGYVMIVGFNPISLWGIRSLINRRSRALPWCGRLLRFSRIHDWLQLLDFELVEHHSLAYGLPFKLPAWCEKWTNKLGFLSKIFPWTGGVSIILARKKRPGYIGPQQKWKPLVSPSLDARTNNSSVQKSRKG